MVEQNGSGRKTLVFLALIFFAPLVVAWLMHFNVISWRPSGLSATGELFEPPVVLQQIAKDELGIENYQPNYLFKVNQDQFLHKKWHLLFVAPALCEEACEQTLLVMRQVHASLGKYYDRIGRVMTVPSGFVVPAKYQEVFADMEIVEHDQFIEKILHNTATDAGDSILLVDPLGNVMMRYPSEQEPRPMYNDMKRLLKISRIG